MPPKRGTTDLHIPLDDALTQKLAHLAANSGQTRKQLIEAAVIAYIEHTGDETMLAGLHQRLSLVAGAIDRLSAEILQLTTRMEARMEKVEASQREVYEAMATMLEATKAQSNGRGWLSRK
jgi:predicted DNA-binding protein